MKLSMACVLVALSVGACTDEVSTGDGVVSVKDTGYKANQDPKTRVVEIGQTKLEQAIANSVEAKELRYSGLRGYAEMFDVEITPCPTKVTSVMTNELNGPGTKESNVDGNQLSGPSTKESVVDGNQLSGPYSKLFQAAQQFSYIVHRTNNDGNLETAEVMLLDGTPVCEIVQTADEVVSDTCTAKKPPPSIGGSVGGC